MTMATGSGTFPAFLRRVSADLPLRGELEDLLCLLSIACRAPFAAFAVAEKDGLAIVVARGDLPRSHRLVDFLCDLAIAGGDLLVVEDAILDTRIPAKQAREAEADLRFYAGVPVLDPAGKPAGALYVCDRVPRTLEPDQREALLRTSVRLSRRLQQAAEQVRTEGLQAERDSALQRLDLYQTVVSNMIEGVMVLQAPGTAILYANPRFEEMFGYGPGELAGRPASALNSPRADQSPDAAAADIIGRLRKSGRASGEILNVRKDGSDFWSHYQIAALEDPHFGELWICVQEDITERRLAEAVLKEAEARARQSQRMEAIGRLSAGIAHEFNNILTSVLGQSELSLVDLPADHPLRPRIEQIRDAAHRAGALSHQLLAFGGRQILQPRAVDVAATLRKLDSRLRSSAGPGIDVQLSLPRGEAWARVDPIQIENVFFNLLVCASERMPRGGRLILEVATHPGGGEVPKGPWIRISARDTGTAPDAEELARTFEPFADPAGPGHTGRLAHAVVYGFAMQSGGHALAALAGTGGLEISVFLPAAEPAKERPRTDSSLWRGTGSGTVLVVEDEAIVRGMVRQVLKTGGYSVLEAADGEEALRICAEPGRQVDLILTDIDMPGMSGIDLARRVQASCPGIPVLLMSGLGIHEEAISAQFAPRLPFIAKPFRPVELIRAVRELLEEKSPRP